MDPVEDGVRRTAVGGGVGAAEGEAAEVDPAEDGVRRTAVSGGVEEEAVEGEVMELLLTLLLCMINFQRIKELQCHPMIKINVLRTSVPRTKTWTVGLDRATIL